MKYKVTLNGKVYEVIVEEGEAVLEAEYEAAAPAAPAQPSPVSAPAPSAPVSGGGEVISAPFPGSVVRICKKSGDPVKKGEPVVVIEAMKMENEISAPRDGKIAAIHVSGGQSVEKGTSLVSLA
ncbi:MAG: acetyl-CoA carboxylase biotin carboxyl carrier protein subunit [Clostridia bacterium]|nr:acetyl-CoA carboxylase biotin carboxyl carrier protein subunit [Clostridia bacterium]